MIAQGLDRVEKTVVGAFVAVMRLVFRRILVNAEKVPSARFFGFTLVIPFLALVALPLGAAELVTLNIWVFDYSLPLDTSLRWVHGHVPHIDYSTPIGVTYWLIQGLATDLIGVDARTPIVANFLAAVPVVVGAMLLLKSRLSGGLFGLMVLACVLLVISPRAPGDIPAQVSFLAAYNKIGLAVLAIVLVGLFVEPRAPRSRGALALDGAIIGLFIVWLIYLKITFAPIAVVGAAAALHYAPGNRFAVLFTAVVSVIGVGIVGATTGLNAAYLQDLADAAATGAPIRWGKMLVDLSDSRIAVAVFVLALVLYERLSGAARSVKTTNMVVGVGLFLAGLVALNQVHDSYLALTFVPLLVLCQRSLVETGPSGGPAGARSFMPPLLGAVYLIMLAMISDAITSVYYFSANRGARIGEPESSLCDDPDVPLCRVVYQAFSASLLERIEPLPTPRLVEVGTRGPAADLLTLKEMHDFCEANKSCVFWKIEQQLNRMLNLHMTREDRPYFLGFTNILPYAYGVEPPRGVPAWMGVGRNISYDSHPAPESLFSDVSLLVVPQVDFQVGWLSEVNEIYEPYIPGLFTLVEESEAWQIWRRKTAEAGAGE